MRTALLVLALAACQPNGVPIDTAPPEPKDDDGDGYTTAIDCDDGNPDVHPEADELCNERDDDCDGDIDEDATDATTWYPDEDDDGYGSEDGAEQVCAQPSGSVELGGDCDDGDPTVSPAAVEICDSIDNDCDGQVDGDIAVPGDYATVAEAVAAASTGDWICVAAGTYVGPVTVQRDVVLEGEGSDAVVLDGGGSSPVLTLDGLGESAEIHGFTLTGGAGSTAVALHSTNSDAALGDLQIADNTVEGDGQCSGALVYIDGGSPDFDGLELRDNSVTCPDTWGLVFIRGSASVTMDHTRLTGNTITADQEVHGAFTVYSGCLLSMENLVIAGNTIQHGTGGAVGVKGLALASEGGVMSVTNASIHGNNVDAGTGMVQAGVIHDTSGGISLTNVSISSNAVSGDSVVATVNQGANGYSYCNIHDQDEPAFSLMDDPRGSLGNIDEDPGYVEVAASDPANWDLSLTADSALRDQGTPSLEDADGSRSDIGAHGGPGGDAW